MQAATQRSFRHRTAAFPAAPRQQAGVWGLLLEQSWGFSPGASRPSGKLIWTPQSRGYWGSSSSFCIEKKGPFPSLSTVSLAP